MKVARERLPIDFLRGRFDSLEDIRGFPKMDLMGEMIFMSPAREAHIHLHQIELQLGSDKKVNSEIHTQHTKKQVILHRTCSFSPWILTVIQKSNRAKGQ
jgi:hypothetical protein